MVGGVYLKKSKMLRLFGIVSLVCIFSFSLMSSAIADPNVCRDLPSSANSDDTITVNLDITLNGADKTYVLETVPIGWVASNLSDSGILLDGGAQVMWATAASPDIQFTYDVTIPSGAEPGAYAFVGEFSLIAGVPVIAVSCENEIEVEPSFTVTPENPLIGDIVTISGSAEPDAELEISFLFNSTLPVENNEYEFIASSMGIAENSILNVTVNGVENLNIQAKLDVWENIADVSTSTGTANYLLSLAPGVYSINISGDALNVSSFVDLHIIRTTQVSTNSSGYYEVSFDTISMPAGEFTIDVDGESNTYLLSSSASSDSSSSATSSGSSTSGGGASFGTTPDDEAGNVVISESYVSRVFSNSQVQFNFVETENPITSINFTSGITRESVPVKIEVLEDVPVVVEEEIPGNVYRYLVIWVGYEDFAGPDNLENIHVDFRVNKMWIDEHSISASDIVLLHYNEATNVWETVTTELLVDNGEYLHYRAYPDSFSPFAIAAPESTVLAALGGETVEIGDSQADGSDISKPQAGSPLLVSSIIILLTLGFVLRNKR